MSNLKEPKETDVTFLRRPVQQFLDRDSAGFLDRERVLHRGRRRYEAELDGMKAILRGPYVDEGDLPEQRCPSTPRTPRDAEGPGSLRPPWQVPTETSPRTQHPFTRLLDYEALKRLAGDDTFAGAAGVPRLLDYESKACGDYPRSKSTGSLNRSRPWKKPSGRLEHTREDVAEDTEEPTDELRNRRDRMEEKWEKHRLKEWMQNRKISVLDLPQGYRGKQRGRMLPTFYLSQAPGAMMLSWDRDLPAVRNLAQVFETGGVAASQVSCILAISSRWVPHLQGSADVMVSFWGRRPQRLHYDIQGGEAKRYELKQYCPYGDKRLSQKVVDLLQEAGFTAQGEWTRGLDSGVWIPFMHMDSFQHVPVVQVSIPHPPLDSNDSCDRINAAFARRCLEVGRALRPLREEGVLIVGSGMAVALGNMNHDHLDAWCTSLKSMCTRAPLSKRWSLLERWDENLPHAREAQTRKGEHLMPLHVVAGAADEEQGYCLGDFRLSKRALVHFKFGEKNGAGQ